MLKLSVLLSLYGWLGLSQAAEWTLKGWLDQSLGYDDNVFMRPNSQAQGSFQYKITPVLNFKHQTEASEVEANASYGTQVYTDVNGLDLDNQRYSLRGLYQTELIDWSLSGNYSVIPTRNTATYDSGNYSIAENTTWSLSPSIIFKIDEINSLNVNSTYSESTFKQTGSNQGVNNFRDFNSAKIGIAWERIWTERYSSSLQWFYNTVDYVPQQQNGSINNFANSFESTGLNFSNTYLWSEKWKFNGTIGFRHTDSQLAQGTFTPNGSTTNSSVGFLANVGVDYTGESFSSGLNFSRALVPSGTGQLQEQTSIGLNFSYQIAERLSAGLAASYQESTYVSGNNAQGSSGNSTNTRKNLFINPSVNWQLSPEWSLTGSYRYRSQTGLFFGATTANQFNSLVDQTADSNLFLLSINYNWQGLKMSR